MSLVEGVRSISLPCATGLSDSQFLFVNINSSGQVALAGAGGRVFGVLQDKPGQNGGTGAGGADDSLGFDGEVGALNGSLRLKVVAGGSITAGQEIKADAAGKAVDATTEVNNAYVAGIALESASADEVFSFTPFVYRQAV